MKISLLDMVEAAEDRANYHRSSAEHYRTQSIFPERFEEHHRKAEVFERMAHVLATMATFEDKSRAFIAGLLEEYRRG